MTMTAAIYARKSTAQEGEGEDRSVERQIAESREFAAAKGWTVLEQHIYSDDNISGAAPLAKLRSKARMLGVIKAGPPFNVLITQAPDRLSRRDGDEAVAEAKAIVRAGVAIHFYADGSRFEYGTFATNTLGFLKAEFAAEYRRSISSKTRESLLRKAKNGFVTGGRTFGYDNVPVNAHVERRVNSAEAAVVVRIHEMYAAGQGLPSIAHTLNADATPRPRPRPGRVSGWCPASVREILKRPLYRGVVVWGAKKKRGADGAVDFQRRPEADWLRVDMPHFRIVPEDLARAVDERFRSQQRRALRLHNGRLMGRPSGEGSPYLLVGLLRCATCCGSMEVLSSGLRGRREFHYRCAVARRKGPACCTNKLAAPMGLADTAVLAAVRDTLLDPRVIAAALVHAERVLLQEQGGDQHASLETELEEVDAALRRLTTAIAKGGDLPSLVGALETHERRRVGLQERLAAVRAPQSSIDVKELRSELRGYVSDWQKLLRGHVHQAQQALRRLVKGRLTFTPHEAEDGRGYYTFEGVGTVRPVLSGAIRKMVAGAGFEPATFGL